MTHSLVNLGSECSYPKGYSLAFIVYGVVITLLFMNFYLESYTKPKKNDKRLHYDNLDICIN